MIKRLTAVLVLAACLGVGSGASGSNPAVDLTDPDGTPRVLTIPVEELGNAPLRLGATWTQDDADPGLPVEGDYMHAAAFSTDGQRVFLTNRVSNNISVFDWPTRALITNIDFAASAGGVAATDDYLIVTAPFENEIHIFDVDTYAGLAVIPSGEQPWVIRVSPDETRAYVSCDIDDVCEVIDLTSLTHAATIAAFPINLVSFGFITENGRSWVRFSGFEVTPDGQYLIVGDNEAAGNVLFINTTTGAVDFSVPALDRIADVQLSGDGAKAIALEVGVNPGQAHQIDLATKTVTSSVDLPAQSSTYDVGVNQDGSKAFIGINGNQSALLRFDTHDSKTFASTYTPFWVGTTNSRSHAISGQFRFSVIDFATEAVIAQLQGINQQFGVVAPQIDRIVSYDPLRFEVLRYYDVANPGSPMYLGATSSGEDPEGDGPRRVAITPDGTKAVIVNVLSGNITIMNLLDKSIEAILPIGDRAQSVAITSDSQWAVVCGMESGAVSVVDLVNATVAANVPTGTRPGEVVITPDDGFAYVANIQSNTVSVVELNGALSGEVAEIAVGTIGVVFVGYGVNSGLAMSPAGDYVLVAASFDDNVKVIDTASNTIVATLPVGDFPLQCEFNGDGTRALVTNYFSGSYSLLDIDGAGSSVLLTQGTGAYPLRMDYNPVDGTIGVGVYDTKQVLSVDPATGNIVGSENFSAYGNVLGVLYDASGGSVVLTNSSGDPGNLHRAGLGAVHTLPAVPSFFDYSSAGDVAVVTMPGPDFATIITYDVTGAPEVSHLPLSSPGVLFPPRPNPMGEAGTISFSLRRESDVSIELVDPSGRRVATVAKGGFGPGSHEVEVGIAGLAGVYFAALRVDGVLVGRQKLIIP